jgi:hypothetical protein
MASNPNHPPKGGKKGGNKGKAKPAHIQAVTMPMDLCLPAAVAAGFGQLETRPAYGSPLLIAGDPNALPKSLASDAIAHLVEGWRYLAAASSALLANAKHQAIHLGYYAELRAAFALFSCSGIRISYPKHRYHNSVGLAAVPSWSGVPTHKATWELWEPWTRSTYADQLFSNRLRILPGVDLGALGQELASASTTGSLVAWGFDLISLGHDHDARNVASYEPSITRKPLQVMTAADLEFLRAMWQLLQPTSTGLEFERTFVHYLIDVELAERGLNEADTEEWYRSLAERVASTTGADENELQLLLSGRPNSRQLFIHATDQVSTWEGVMSRAVFLLRLASKAVEDAMGTEPSGTGKPWLIDWLIHAGILEPHFVGSAPNLWSDFEDLPTFALPVGVVPNSFRTDFPSSNLAQRLARPDASLAWSMSL